eukprot:TRINITY_DN1596_c0_g1_i1.p1 TRINITY_DN1596_c0_g1~~TRINITY_DN1596_c0_g1_i1.p1  ORF type:complete len:128 (-),score=0.97 TRINITY_DN1596_c0_g1_i1:279-662(-)
MHSYGLLSCSNPVCTAPQSLKTRVATQPSIRALLVFARSVPQDHLHYRMSGFRRSVSSFWRWPSLAAVFQMAPHELGSPAAAAATSTFILSLIGPLKSWGSTTTPFCSMSISPSDASLTATALVVSM